MIKQKLICLNCKKIVKEKNINCSYCKGDYSLLSVKYYSAKIFTLEQLYKSYLPFSIFKKDDFKNCSLTKFYNNIWLKNEGENDSKSIKEKDIFIGLKVASYLDFKKTLCVSSGSGKNVVNFFSKKDCLPLIKLYFLKGKDYEKNFKLALQNKDKEIWNVTPGINPYSQEGSKIIAWQLIDSKINFDAVVIPCGNGSTLWGIYKGFFEAKEQKLIKKIPKIFGVELINGPIGRSLKTGKIEKNNQLLNSKAHSIDVKESFCLQKALIAIKKSLGGIVYVSEQEINRAYIKLHQNNYKSCFTASASLAGTMKLKKFKKICCILTANES